MSDTIRSFIAFKLPEKTIASIRDVQENLKSYGFNIRWVQPQNIHLTLKFLGATSSIHTDKIKDAMVQSASDAGSIWLEAKGVGLFPDIRRPRVLWVGIAGQTDPLYSLQKRLEEALSIIGFAKEKRLYRGHLTVGRVKGKIVTKKLQDAMDLFKDFRSQPFTLSELSLFKSDLKSTGAEYTELMRVSMV